jgi:16S rRNA (cytidine1402-2'-O)-methyltransferase
LPTDAFRFCGFLPPRQGQRRNAIEAVAGETVTLVFYEAPHRIAETLEDLAAVLGDRPAALGREVTKLHEEFLRGSLVELRKIIAERPSAARGEFTIVVGRAEHPVASTEPLADAVRRLERTGVPRMDAMKQVARERGLSKRDVYRALESENSSDRA